MARGEATAGVGESAGAGAGADAGVGVTVEVKSKRLDTAGDAACVGAGESKRLRISLAVVLCGWEADVGAVGDIALEPPKISARRSSLVFWPPGTDATGSEGVDTSSPSKSAFLEKVASEKKGMLGQEMFTYALGRPDRLILAH